MVTAVIPPSSRMARAAARMAARAPALRGRPRGREGLLLKHPLLRLDISYDIRYGTSRKLILFTSARHDCNRNFPRWGGADNALPRFQGRGARHRFLRARICR